MSKACLTLLALLVTAVSGISTSRAADSEPPVFNRNWTAVSTTAMGITGDVRMTAESITFDDRVTFRWRALGEIAPQPQGMGMDNFERFTVYELIDPKPRAIKSGVHLCGWPKYQKNIPLPRYIAVSAYTGNLSDQLGIVVTSGKTPPKDVLYVKGDFCGSFGYAADKSQP